MGLISGVSSRTYRAPSLPPFDPTVPRKMNRPMSNEETMRNMRDFFEQYNRTTDYCFNLCVTNFNKRSLSNTENICIRSCGLKTIKGSQRNQMEFQELLPKLMEKQVREQQEKAEKKQKEEEAARFAEFAEREMAKTAEGLKK